VIKLTTTVTDTSAHTAYRSLLELPQDIEIIAMASSSNRKRTYCDAFDTSPTHRNGYAGKKSKGTSVSVESSPHKDEHTNKENEAPAYRDHKGSPNADEPSSLPPAQCNLTLFFQELQNPPLRTLVENVMQASEEAATAEDSGPGFPIFEDETATREVPEELAMEKLALNDK
jgi:hypothetical protein